MTMKKTIILACLIIGIAFINLNDQNIWDLDSQLFVEQKISKQNFTPPKILMQRAEPVIGMVLIGEDNGNSSIIISGYLSRVVAFNLSSNSILWNNTFGLNASTFIWKIIPNSLNENVTGVIISLANGTIFEVNALGQVIWHISIGTQAISNLALVQSPNNDIIPFYIVFGGENNRTTWLAPNGTIIHSNDTFGIITIIKSQGKYTMVGTALGKIFLYNGTENLWNVSIGSNQVLSINLYQNTVIAYSYGDDVIFYDLHNGSVLYNEDFGLLTYNSIHILNQIDNLAYLAKSNGEFLAINISDRKIIWNNTAITSYVTYIVEREFTGDIQADLILTTSTGNIFIVNPLTGIIITSENILTSSQISSLIVLDFNQDNINDIVIGTLNGKVLLILGNDISAPEIMAINLVNVTSNKILITINLNEPSTVQIKFGKDTLKLNTSISKLSYLFQHEITLTGLDAGTIYFYELIICDIDDNCYTKNIEQFMTDFPPVFSFVESDLTNIDTSQSYSLTVLSELPVNITIKYGINSIDEYSQSIQSFGTNQSIILQNLVSNATYIYNVIVCDEAGSCSKNSVGSFRTTLTLPQFPFFEFGIGGFLLIGFIISGHIYNQRRIRKLAFIEAENALENNDYINSIRHFYKAKEKGRIIEIITLLVKNPALSSYVNEVLQMEELSDYLFEVKEIMKQTD